MSKKRKQYNASFKPKVALAAIKGDEITSEIAARFSDSPNDGQCLEARAAKQRS